MSQHLPIHPLTHISDCTVADFMARYWQKEAYLAREAFPDFKPLLSIEELLSLSTQEEVESRLIIQRDDRTWEVEYGPFSARKLKKLPAANWTLLVQGVNLWDTSVDQLLRRFSFLPYARLDDLMISYAVDGGGVGPHFDSYDVFLLQAYGKRQWSVGTQEDLSLRPDLPVKILQHFEPQYSWILEPGDMLYLPPRYAHDGIAQGECMTYSIGFRSPSHQEWAQGFLNFWHDELQVDGIYQDTGLKLTQEPASIPTEIQEHVVKVIQQILWSKNDIHRYVGQYLTQPKDTIFFDPPARPYSARRFREDLLKKGLYLDKKTQMLYDHQALYCNGEEVLWSALPSAAHPCLRLLANCRLLTPEQSREAVQLIDNYLYEGYRNGYWYA